MSTVPHYVIDVHHHLHTCLANPTEHIVQTRRTVVSAEPGGPCTRPATFTVNGRSVQVSCARVRPPAQQCPACRVTITVRHTTTTNLGQAVPHPRTVPSGLLKDPCDACGLPVDAALADTGRHLLCPAPGGAT
jgi:hypothetical protein